MTLLRERIAENISYEKFLTTFEKDVCSSRLIIGNFQRNYVWKKKHVYEMIDAISGSDQGYYFGNIVIQQGSGGSVSRDVIVDGQQRLISLSLILVVLRSEFEAIGEKDLVNEINGFIFERSGSKEGRIMFWRTEQQRIYKKIINNPEKMDSRKAKVSEKKLIKQLELISVKIKGQSDLRNFFYKIKTLEFVVIKCPSLHDVNQLYEGLNSRGKRLTPVEQTKNLLLGSLKETPTQAKKIESIWECVEQLFEKKNDVWFDKFLRHQFFSIGGYAGNAELFEKIRERFVLGADGVLNYSKVLKEDAVHYLYLREAEFSKKVFNNFIGVNNDSISSVNGLLRSIKFLGLDQVYALLLALVKYAEKNKSYGSNTVFLKDLKKILSFFILAKYSGISPASYEKILANFCYDILNKKEFQSCSVKELSRIKNQDLFEKLQGLVLDRSSIFKKNINDLLRYSTNKGIRSDDGQYVRMILNIYLTDEGELIPDKQTTIEHIIPQGNLKFWKKISSKIKNKIENPIRYKLGNLTLFVKNTETEYLNTQISNSNFDSKYEKAYGEKTGYIKNSYLSKFKVSFNSSNPGVAVEKRGSDIAVDIYEKLIKQIVL